MILLLLLLLKKYINLPVCIFACLFVSLPACLLVCLSNCTMLHIYKLSILSPHVLAEIRYDFLDRHLAWISFTLTRFPSL